MQEILKAHAELSPLPIENLNPEYARLVPLLDRAALVVYGTHFLKKALAPMPLPVGKVENLIIPAGNSDLMIRVYTPKGNTPEHGWPIVVYYHGGGWVIANLDTYDSSCRALCDLSKAVVISVHYSQAPEYKWPAAAEDAFAAYKWICENAAGFKGDRFKIAVAGESAGGNLAAIVTLKARDKGFSAPIHQVLVYPVTDLEDGMNSVSAKENADAKPLNTKMLEWFYDNYLPEDVNKSNPYVSPLYADLQNLPNATIILAEIDPLRSEGEAYATKLQNAGSNVNLKIYSGVTHEFFGLVGLLDEAAEAVKTVADDLKKAFEDVEHQATHQYKRVSGL